MFICIVYLALVSQDVSIFIRWDVPMFVCVVYLALVSQDVSIFMCTVRLALFLDRSFMLSKNRSV